MLKVENPDLSSGFHIEIHCPKNFITCVLQMLFSKLDNIDYFFKMFPWHWAQHHFCKWCLASLTSLKGRMKTRCNANCGMCLIYIDEGSYGSKCHFKNMRRKWCSLSQTKPLHAVNSRGQGFSLNILFSSEVMIFSGFYPSMAVLPVNGPGGQTGRGAPGQYVYWICMAHPTQETLVAKPGMKTPADFSRESFAEFVVWARRRKMMAALLCLSAACSQRWGSGVFY